MRAYFYSVLRAASRLINASIGGWSGETISGRAWREDIEWLVAVLDTIWWVLGDGEGHCREAYVLDYTRADYPSKLGDHRGRRIDL